MDKWGGHIQSESMKEGENQGHDEPEMNEEITSS